MAFFLISKQPLRGALIITLLVTFFASFSLFAQSQGSSDAKVPRKQQIRVKGKGTTAGGGQGSKGGGVIVCDGQQPVLTDLWEAVQREKTLSSSRAVEGRLVELRLMDIDMDYVIRSFSRNYNLWIAQNDIAYFSSEESWEKAVRHWMRSVMTTIRYVIDEEDGYSRAVGGSYVSEDDSDFIPINPSVSLSIGRNTKISDPKDSGKVIGLPAPGCREERVAVSNIQTSERAKNELTTFIRLPELFKKMPKIDQLALMFGHEVFYGLSGGKLTLQNIIQNSKLSSEAERRFLAWLVIASPDDIRRLKRFGPLDTKEGHILCDASSQQGRREQRILFEIYPNSAEDKTLFKLTNVNWNNLRIPTFAELPWSPQTYQNVPKYFMNPPYLSGSSLYLREPNFRIPSVELLQIIPDLFKPVEATQAGYSVSFKANEEGRTYISLSQQKKTVFTGEVKCNLR